MAGYPRPSSPRKKTVPRLFSFSCIAAVVLLIAAVHSSLPRTTAVIGYLRSNSTQTGLEQHPKSEEAEDTEDAEAEELARGGSTLAPPDTQPTPLDNESIGQHEAGIIQPLCSDAKRAKVTRKVLEQNGGPPVMAWGCDLEQCGGGFVQRTVAYMRATPRFSSLLTMLPCDVWSAIRGRTVWLAGDSQSQRFYRQLRCFLNEFLEQEPHKRRDEKLTEDPEEMQQIKAAVLEGHDSCCGVGMPICTYLVGSTRICHARINKGAHMLKYMQNLDALWVQKHDIWAFNIGLWHHKRENQYAGLAKALADHYEQHKEQLPVVIWRDNSPQHFKIENGEFPHPEEASKLLANKSGCQPIAGVELLPDGTLGGNNSHVRAGGWRNRITGPLFSGVGIPIHATWNDTIDTWDSHVGGDCTHFCSPGSYNIYVWSFWRLLLRLGIHGDGPAAAAAAYARHDWSAAAPAAHPSADEQPNAETSAQQAAAAQRSQGSGAVVAADAAGGDDAAAAEDADAGAQQEEEAAAGAQQDADASEEAATQQEQSVDIEGAAAEEQA